MRKTVSLRLFSVAFASIFSIAGCQDIYKYNTRPNLEKLLPAEIYDVQIDSTKNPIQAGEYYIKNKGFVQARAYFEKALEHEPKNRPHYLDLPHLIRCWDSLRRQIHILKYSQKLMGRLLPTKMTSGFQISSAVI